MIKIQNIYYMLAYAYQVLNEDSYKKISFEDFEHTEDLLAAILAKGIANQLKRGLGREYVPTAQSLNSPRGRINISASIKGREILNKRLYCEFDEFSQNVYTNQILKTAAKMLIRSDKVRMEQRKSLKKIMLCFHGVDTLNPFEISWSGIKYHCNNATYKMLMSICYLIVETLLPSLQEGARGITHYTDDHMHQLFERFVREYYRKEHPDCTVSASHIEWQTDDGNATMLPQMKTDITLKHGSKTLIIDTKYYSRAVQTNVLYDSRTIHSGNLYQIYAYVKNKDTLHSGEVSGLLLYAKANEDVAFNNNYRMDGNSISVKSLNLDNDFAHIRNQLDRILDEWIGR